MYSNPRYFFDIIASGARQSRSDSIIAYSDCHVPLAITVL